MGHGWERERAAQRMGGRSGKECRRETNVGHFCRSLNKKSPRPELGDWKERRRKGAREGELTNITVQGRREAPSFPG